MLILTLNCCDDDTCKVDESIIFSLEDEFVISVSLFVHDIDKVFLSNKQKKDL